MAIAHSDSANRLGSLSSPREVGDCSAIPVGSVRFSRSYLRSIQPLLGLSSLEGSKRGMSFDRQHAKTMDFFLDQSASVPCRSQSNDLYMEKKRCCSSFEALKDQAWGYYSSIRLFHAQVDVLGMEALARSGRLSVQGLQTHANTHLSCLAGGFLHRLQ